MYKACVFYYIDKRGVSFEKDETQFDCHNVKNRKAKRNKDYI